jgi:hypothetical protein
MSTITSHSERRPTRRPSLFSAVACGLLAVSGLSAQQPAIDDKEPSYSHGYSDPNVPFSRSGGHSTVVGGHASTGVASAFPNNGKVGAVLKVSTRSLPVSQSAQISLGAMRDGFEVIRTGYVDNAGRFDGRDTVEVTIPEWVQNDRPYLLIVSDLAYTPFAPAEMVHPTDARGMVRRKGMVRQEAMGGCLTLTGDAGELYYLSAQTSAVQAGREARIEGRVIQNGRCGVGTTIDVRSARVVAQR